LAPGVHAAIRTEPGRNVVHGNSLIVVNDADVLVVDATGTPAEARRLIAAIRALTPKPVRWIVLTHWHDDHALGAPAFLEAWPGAEVLAHRFTRDAMLGDAIVNRARYVKELPGILDFVRGRLAAGQGLDGAPADSAELRSLAADVALGDAYLAQADSLGPPARVTAVEDRSVIRSGTRIIELLHFGHGSTAGDLVVWLPRERVLAAGDLLVHPTPYVFRSHLRGWIAALDSIGARQPVAIVPGHGPVLHDGSYPARVRRALVAVLERTAAAAARGLTAEQARDSVDLADLEREFAGSDRIQRFAWRNYFAGPAVAQGMEEAGGRGTGSGERGAGPAASSQVTNRRTGP
jgi:glyoxylase-like metal-dependent hydrolase (beta-lactamase superfamily II)